MSKKVPSVCYECVATQLILRTVGFTSAELGISVTKTDKNNTDVDLTVQRNNITELIDLGNIKLPHRTVMRYWESWLETATKELVDDFTNAKKLFYSLIAYKSMPTLLVHLEAKGFVLTDTQIAETFNS